MNVCAIRKSLITEFTKFLRFLLLIKVEERIEKEKQFEELKIRIKGCPVSLYLLE